MTPKIRVILNISEIGAGTRGASLGPQAIISAARKKESDFFDNYRPYILPIFNELLDKPTAYIHAKRIDGMVNVYENIKSEVEETLSKNIFPFIIAGDHCSAGATIAGIKNANPSKRIGVIWVDAHADLHTPYTTPSGNLHGMPLAAAIGLNNIDCQRNNVDEETANLWNQLKSNSISTDDLVFVAVRDTEPEEDYLINENKIKNYSVEEIRSLGINEVLCQIETKLQNCDLIYISFDVDSMDPILTSHGTGTPVPNGLSPFEAKELLKGCLNFPKTATFELVEVNPCLDEKQNLMAEIAFDIIEDLMVVLEKK
jgi:arginase